MRETAVSDDGDKVLSPSVRMQSRGEGRCLGKQRRQKAEVKVPFFGSVSTECKGRRDLGLLSAIRYPIWCGLTSYV